MKKLLCTQEYINRAAIKPAREHLFTNVEPYFIRIRVRAEKTIGLTPIQGKTINTIRGNINFGLRNLQEFTIHTIFKNKDTYFIPSSNHHYLYCVAKHDAEIV